MSKEIIFETERLYFRHPSTDDAPIMIPAANSIWDDIRRFMTFGQAESYDLDQALFYIENICPEDINKGGVPLVGFRKDTHEFAIACGLIATDDPQIFTTGYWVPKAQQGQGFATEATMGSLQYAFNTLGACKVCISYYAGNDASLRIIEKCGFEFVEVKEKYALNHASGEMVDEYFYAITREQYMRMCL